MAGLVVAGKHRCYFLVSKEIPEGAASEGLESA